MQIRIKMMSIKDCNKELLKEELEDWPEVNHQMKWKMTLHHNLVYLIRPELLFWGNRMIQAVLVVKVVLDLVAVIKVAQTQAVLINQEASLIVQSNRKFSKKKRKLNKIMKKLFKIR